MKTWLRQHLRTFGASLYALSRAPLASLFNIAVVGIALALPAGLYVALVNVQSAARAVAPEPQLTLFLALDATREHAAEIDSRLKAHREVAFLRFVPRERALEDMQAMSGMPGIAAGLNGNPLPDAFVVDARDPSPAALARLQSELASWPKVARVQLDSEWAQRLDAALEFGRVAVLLFATLLAFALVAITFNTIRLQILTRREEVEVAALIGATDAFIRRPFLYYGLLLGLFGGLAAWALVSCAVALLNGALADLSRHYGASWQLAPLSPADTAGLLAFAGALGWLGAWLCAARHLAAVRLARAA